MKNNKIELNKINLLSSLINNAGYKKTIIFGLFIISNYFLEIVCISLGLQTFTKNNFNYGDFTLNQNISLIIFLIMIILSLRSLLKSFCLNIQEKIKCELNNKFKEDTLENILYADFENIKNIGRGSLNKILLLNISKSISSLDQFLRLINQIVCFVAYLIGLLIFQTYDIKLIIIVIISSLISLQIYKPNTWNLGVLINKYSGKLNKIIGNGLIGIKTIKAAGSEKWLIAKFKQSNKNYKTYMLKNIFRNNFFNFVKDVIVLFSVGLWLILVINSLSVINAITTLLFCYRLSNSLMNGIRHWRSCINGLPAYQELKITTSKIKKCIKSDYDQNKSSKTLKTLIKNKNDIDSIFWENKNIKKLTLNKLTLKKGEITVISGISGIGKTQLIDVFIGLQNIEDSSWDIFYKDKKLRIDKLFQVRNLLQNLVSYAPQESILLEMSLKENLLLGNEKTYSDREIEESLKELYLEKLTQRDFGLNKEIDFSINPYSGGELQRINILRCWLKNNIIEIYDEPTTYLDELSIKNILNKIKTRSNNKMILIVSHDFRVISLADNHIILD